MTAPAPRRWQVLLLYKDGSPLVAGLPAAVRAAFRAGRELGPDRIVIAGAGDAFMRRWAAQLRSSAVPVLGDKLGAAALDARLPVLALDAESFPDEGALAEFAAAAEGVATAGAGDARRSVSGRPVAALRWTPGPLGAGTRSPEEVHARALSGPGAEVGAGHFFDARGGAARVAADALCARLAKDNDGYIAKFDRTLSIAISRMLLPFPVTPNHVTTAGLALGILGAWWLAAPSSRLQFWGALVLWFCCLLDGCDGEIARLKHLQSESGAKYDLWADHFSHLATFVALPVGVARLHPGHSWLVPGVLLVTGFLACGFSVWYLVLRVPEEKRGPLAVVVERIASRDYVYLIVALTAIGRLDWFVWAAAVGSHVFNAWLWLVARRSASASA
ncbi:MAG: CDP-alcohol phosphatidyltransferase family protein [Elusimicrobiota bacterium]|nr:MAG: CDP-alcohol phosphatidyltransferase family protein [Elusimicrobiota bacterium]